MQYRTEASRIFLTDAAGRETAVIRFPETAPGIYTIDHTFVDDSLRGQGVAGQLVERAIAEIHRRGGTAAASCSYAEKWMETHRIRPHILCHMVTSIDGKVTGDFLYSEKGLEVCETYYTVHRQLKGDAFACGRVTMESSFTHGFRPDVSSFARTEVPEGDYVAQNHAFYAVSFDRYGRVGWTDSRIRDDDPGYDDCHIIEVLCEDTPKENLAYYRSIGVSYVFAGKDDIDLRLALDKLHRLFGIRRLQLEGGSILNGAFQREGLIDELSLVAAPLVAGKEDLPLFDGSTMASYQLHSAAPMPDGSVWLRYRR